MEARDARPEARAPFFQPGRNAWRVAPARRVGVLIDAQSYFRAFLSSLLKAERFVVILAWDVDSRVSLEQDPASPNHGLTLADAIERVLREKPGLEIYVLCWHYSVILLFEREWFARFRRPFTHPRVHFVFDERHPFIGSHHQKVIVIDGRLAFVGGIDLCSRRWDTRDHRVSDERRVDLEGKPYLPFHDLQAVVEGEVASDLLALAADRWEKATGRPLPPARVSAFRPARGLAPDPVDLWPESVPADFEDVDVAVARTHPGYGTGYGGCPEVHEVRRLYLDSIRSARRYVYIENQYFTSEEIAAAIKERLAEDGCPEFLVVLPRRNSGVKEETTMGVLRDRLIRRLREADRSGRLRFCYPVAAEGVPIAIHSKIMIVDDEILRLGSSNLSSRSMGLDSECDVGIGAAGDPAVRRRIAGIRASLLAEHLGAAEDAVSFLIRGTGSLFATVDALSPECRDRRLLPFEKDLSRIEERFIPDVSPLVDPPCAAEREPFFRHFLPPEGGAVLSARYLFLNLRFLGVLALGLAFSSAVGAPLRAFLHGHLPALAGAAAFFCALLLLLPLDVMILLAAAALPPEQAVAVVAFGIGGAACVLYGIGRVLPVETGSASPRRVNGGFWETVLVHLSLIASFAQVSLKAGRDGIGSLRYLAASLVGTLPRALVMVLCGAVLRRYLEEPGWRSFSVLVLVAAATLGFFRSARRRFLVR